MKITFHAKKRLSERFPKVKEKVESLINKSIPFGEGEKEKFLLNQEYDIVFVVCKVGKSDQLRTVLTKDQHFSQNPKKITKPSLSDIEIKLIAKEFCENCDFSCPNKKKRKEFTKTIIEKGINPEKINQFWNCVMKMIYQHHNKTGG
jgi:hypothetical protein